MTKEQMIARLWEKQGDGFFGATNLELAVINVIQNASEEDQALIRAALDIPENDNAGIKDQSFLTDLMRFIFQEDYMED